MSLTVYFAFLWVFLIPLLTPTPEAGSEKEYHKK